MLLRYTEGAVWTAVIAAVVTPLGEMFWMLFGDPDWVRWHPEFPWQNIFPIIGLCIMMPCVYLYNRYSEEEEGGGDGNATKHGEDGPISMDFTSSVDDASSSKQIQGRNHIDM